jgi:hypothetical protein
MEHLSANTRTATVTRQVVPTLRTPRPSAAAPYIGQFGETVPMRP